MSQNAPNHDSDKSAHVGLCALDMVLRGRSEYAQNLNPIAWNGAAAEYHQSVNDCLLCAMSHKESSYGPKVI